MRSINVQLLPLFPKKVGILSKYFPMMKLSCLHVLTLSSFLVWSTPLHCGPQLQNLILSSWTELCFQSSFYYQILVLTCGIDRVSFLCLLQKIYYSNKHQLHLSLPGLAVFAHNIKQATAANSIPFSSVRFQ